MIQDGNDWLTDIFNLGGEPKEAVCSVCRQRETINPKDFFPVCNRCYYKTSQFEQEAQDQEEFDMTLQTGGPFDEQSKYYQGT